MLLSLQFVKLNNSRYQQTEKILIRFFLRLTDYFVLDSDLPLMKINKKIKLFKKWVHLTDSFLPMQERLSYEKIRI